MLCLGRVGSQVDVPGTLSLNGCDTGDLGREQMAAPGQRGGCAPQSSSGATSTLAPATTPRQG